MKNLFFPDGTLRAQIGRPGDGPGEFRAPVGLSFIRGDSLLVLDSQHNRLTIVDPDFLSIARTVQLEGHLSSIRLVGLLTSDTLVIEDVTVRAPEGTAPEMVPATLLMFDLTGARVGTIGEFPKRRWAWLRENQIFTVPLDPVASFVAEPAGLWVATAASYQVDLIDPHNGQVRRTTWGGANRRVTAQDKAEWTATLLNEARTDDALAAVTALAADVVFADERAAYERIIPVEEGGVWIEAVPRPGTEVSWLVLGVDGALLARVSGRGTPRLFYVSSGHATALEADEWGVPQLVVYRIEELD